MTRRWCRSGPIAAGLDVPVLVKCEHLNPGGSVKDRIALAIVLDAERRGVLRPGDTIVEATAGNTGVGLALVAGARGYELVCVMPEKMSPDKRAVLAALGARVEITPNAPLDDPGNFQQVAGVWPPSTAGSWPTSSATRPIRRARTGDRPGDPGPERRPHRRVRRRRRHGRDDHRRRPVPAARCPGARVVLADPLGSGLADWVETRRAGPDTGYLIEGIGAGAPPAVMDRAVIDAAERVTDADSFAMVGRLLREEGCSWVGRPAPPSPPRSGWLAPAASTGPSSRVLPDSWDRYLSTAWFARCSWMLASSGRGILENEDASRRKARIRGGVRRPDAVRMRMMLQGSVLLPVTTALSS